MGRTQLPGSGDLIISSVADADGWFARTVVLMLDVDASGALGVVLNRVSDVPLAAVLPAWVDQVSQPRVMFAGGPVSPDGAICLAAPVAPKEQPPGWREIAGGIGLLHLDTPVELVAGAYADLRIFAGYAGWEAGQLDAEMAAGAWYCASSRYPDLFGGQPERLWRDVLRRQPPEVAVYATWPDDPDQN